ncbi:hypothetical protein QUB68_06470 [Microcoleus sp. A006_D1]|uniref:hypothetical protein n=1 Tax=Microcoleus sp. A006_D1 TaxID=3055267 RepID=UPI002FD2B830
MTVFLWIAYPEFWSVISPLKYDRSSDTILTDRTHNESKILKPCPWWAKSIVNLKSLD